MTITTHRARKTVTRKGRTFQVFPQSNYPQAGPDGYVRPYTTYTFAEVIDGEVGLLAVCGVHTVREVDQAIREYADGQHATVFHSAA